MQECMYIQAIDLEDADTPQEQKYFSQGEVRCQISRIENVSYAE